jgi:hypothetical protein
MARAIPAAAAAFLVVVFGFLYLSGYRDQYLALLAAWGADPFRFPFLDTHNVLAAIECYRRGIDVYVENPCDVLGRLQVYSPLWLSASVLPITTAWTPAIGLGSVVLFLLSLTLLPPGRGWWQIAIITLGTISGTTAYAIERGNNDLVVFVLAVLAGRLVQQSRALRFLGYGFALFAAALKFYPATLLALAIRERPAVFLAIGLVSAGACASFIAYYAHDLPRVLSVIPTFSYFNYLSFGARDLPYGLAQMLGWPERVASGLLIVLTAGTVLYATVLARRGDLPARIDALGAAEATFLLIGCVLLVGCFFTAQNVLYRGIYFLFVLPGLTAIAAGPGERPKFVFVIFCVLVVLLMWGESIHLFINWASRQNGLPEWLAGAVSGRSWILRQMTWWAVVIMLVTLMIAVVLRSPLVRDLAARFPTKP